MLLRSKEAFKFWKSIGMDYMFLGIEAIDEDGLRKFRKRVPLGRNFEALEFARSLGIEVAINLIADPDWDKERFAIVREWCMDVPEIVNISINTPYPGTESWVTEERRLSTRDYRLYDIQHAVLPTRLPRREFYDELLTAQRVVYSKHLNRRTAPIVARYAFSLLLRGQTNFLRGTLRYNGTYNLEKMLSDLLGRSNTKSRCRRVRQNRPTLRPGAGLSNRSPSLLTCMFIPRADVSAGASTTRRKPSSKKPGSAGRRDVRSLAQAYRFLIMTHELFSALEAESASVKV